MDRLTGYLGCGQPESIANDLLVQHSPELEDDVTDRDPRRPVVKGTLSFTHTVLQREIGQLHVQIQSHPAGPAIVRKLTSFPLVKTPMLQLTLL